MAKVIIAEDEPALLDSFCELVQLLGHESLPARDGGEAIALARRHVPDLVVTDFMMPGKTGVDVARAIRADPLLSHVPVVLLSAGRPRQEEREEAWTFLSKPVGIEALERAIRDGLALSRAYSASKALPSSHTDRNDASPIGIAREEMLNWVSHEIKSPLSAALNASELALRGIGHGEETATTENRLRTINRHLQRMAELVNAVLDAAQLEDGKLPCDLHELELADWLGERIAFWKDFYPERELILRSERELKVEADPDRLRQIVDNLLSNAIKYSDSGTSIEVEVATTEGAVEVSVVDHGRGIDAKELPHIFDRFHRVDGQGGRGHGLGLYIAASLARLHGGTLSVHSRVGEGSRFVLTLPKGT